MTTTSSPSSALAILVAICAALLSGCHNSNDSNPSGAGITPPPNPPQAIGKFDPLPGIRLAITEVAGGGGVGRAQPGDFLTVRFTARTAAGADLNVAGLEAGAIYVSGPTTNYQRVIAEQTDLRSASVLEEGGIWRYTFKVAIPATYLPPLNDSTSFGPEDGELQGQALQAGTYTVGIELQTHYVNGSSSYVDAGAAVADFLVGDASALSPRQVVGNDNCNVCHTELRVHDGRRKDVRLCVLCHTAGAEDSNASGATPGVSIEFKVMVHRLHNGSHLPSVLGVSVANDGSRRYPGDAGAVPPQPLVFADDEGATADFSNVNFPVFPNFNIAMPKDAGYSALSSVDPDGAGPLLSQRGCEDRIRQGVTACNKCHGDPDAAGPLSAPAQGERYRTAPSRRACCSCHDDVDRQKPYTANGQTMVAGVDDASCTQCHTDLASNQPIANYQQLSVTEAHLHPLNNPAIDPGVVCTVTEVTGGTQPSGNFQVGDRPIATFTLRNEAGDDIGVASMDSCSALFLGPTTNRQLVMPPAATNGVAVNPFDFTGRLQAVSATNKGTMSKVFLGSTAVAETLVVEFTSATAFTVTGTTSGALGNGTLPAAASTNASGASVSAFALDSSLATGTVQIIFSDATHFAVSGAASGTGTLPAATNASTRFVSPTFACNITVGTTAFAAGNAFQIGLFRGGAANPVLFAVVAGRTAFSSAAPARDRFYYEVVPDAATYSVNIPMDLSYEFLGDSTGAAAQALPPAGNLPVYYGRQQLFEATATVTATTSTEDVGILARSMAIAPITGLANNDFVVIEPTAGLGAREYVQIQPTKPDGTTAGTSDTTVRLYFKLPLRYAHASGAAVSKVTLALKQEGANNAYTLNGALGVATATGTFTPGTALVMSYRSQARFGYKRHSGDALQSYYTTPPNDTAAIGQEQGDWQGLPYQDGTYTVDLWLYKSIDLGLNNEVQTYRSTSVGSTKDFLFGNADTIVPHAIISSGANCNKCHDDLSFHGGGRRGTEACLTCHSISGATNSIVTTPTTQSVPIEFRQMLHKIHLGEDLANAATYPFATEGTFPAMPGGVRQCVRCHGNDAWKQPSERVHPSATVPVRVWGDVCGACHDGSSAQAHIAANTAGTGYEACAVCHAPDRDFPVEKVHLPR